jgi:hypothetical protein
MLDDDGQAHTLEAVSASILVLSGLVFAMQITAVTPLSASTSSQHIENQQAATAEGVLSAALSEGAVTRAITNWDENNEEFFDADDSPYFTNDGSVEGFRFGEMLVDAFDRRGVTFNVLLSYRTAGSRERIRLVYRGEPSDNAVRESRTVTIFDDTPIHEDVDGDGRLEETGTAVSDANTFWTADASPSTGVYNVVRVEVVVWRM